MCVHEYVCMCVCEREGERERLRRRQRFTSSNANYAELTVHISSILMDSELDTSSSLPSNETLTDSYIPVSSIKLIQ